MASSSFMEFVRKIRSGDAGAAAELMERFGDHVNRFLRFRRNAGLASDVFQDVFLSFIVRAGNGQFELEEMKGLEDLRRFLVGIARKKLNHQLRKRRPITGADALTALADSHASPIQQMEQNELALKILKLREKLPDDVRHLYFLRHEESLAWEKIAEIIGEKPDALRRKLSRAIDKAAHEIGLDEWWCNE